MKRLREPDNGDQGVVPESTLFDTTLFNILHHVGKPFSSEATPRRSWLIDRVPPNPIITGDIFSCADIQAFVRKVNHSNHEAVYNKVHNEATFVVSGVAQVTAAFDARPTGKVWNGFGTISWTTGERYKGGISAAPAEEGGSATVLYPDGKGKFTFRDGITYAGRFNRSYILRSGKIKTPHGVIYEGYLRNDIPDGYGHITIPGRLTYAGKFAKGLPKGYGKVVLADGTMMSGNVDPPDDSGDGSVYIFGKNPSIPRFNGTGEIITPKNTKKEGFLENGKLNGTGIVHSKGCQVHKWGMFKNGKLHGMGRREDKREHSSKAGKYTEGVLNGEGLYRVNDAFLRCQFTDSIPVPGLAFIGRESSGTALCVEIPAQFRWKEVKEKDMAFRGFYHEEKKNGPGILSQGEDILEMGIYKDGLLIAKAQQ